MTNLPYLTDQESAVYLASLELGSDTVQHIAKKSSLPRSSVYLILDDLKKRGLISETKKGKKTLIVPESPDKLLTIGENKKKQTDRALQALRERLPELRAIHNTKKNKPVISFYEGVEGIKTILYKTLKAKEICVYCSGYKKPIQKHLASFLTKNYFPEVQKRRIKTRELLGPAPDIDEYIRTYANTCQKMKKISKPYKGAHIDKLIFSDITAIVSYETLHSTVLVHPDITRFERELFLKLWNSLSNKV